MDLLTITIGIGLGDIHFGLTREETRGLLGEPSSVLDDLEDSGREIWIYEHHALALGFDRTSGHRLSSIEISNSAATLNGQKLLGCEAEHAALELEKSFAFPIEVVLEEGDVPQQLRVPDLHLSLWIEGSVIESIGWSVLEGDGNEVLWPESVAN